MEEEQMINIYLKDKIKINNEIYSLKVYLDTEYISFEVTVNFGAEKIFFERFNNTQLGIMDPSFKNCDLDKNFAEIYDKLESEQYRIERNEANVKFIIKKNRITKLIFELKEKLEDDNINYNILSDGMKKIIDKGELIIGIDLGTTYSCASVFIDNKRIIIPNPQGEKTTASYVSFLSKDMVCVGNLAKLYPAYEKNIIYNIKRIIGKSYNEIKDILEKKLLTYEIIEDKEFNTLKIKIKLDDNSEIYFYPEQISALILKKIILDSEYYLTKKIGKNIKIKNVVITVPAYFNQKQRKATKNAVLIAGLNVKGMINEPTAACLAYSYDSLENKRIYIVVIDFGGGTLDITLIEFEKSINGIYCFVKFAYGDSNFGGNDFDNIIMENCLKKRNGDINKNLPENKRLKEVCEKAKIKLSKFGSVKFEKCNKSDELKEPDKSSKPNESAKPNEKFAKIFLEAYKPKDNIDTNITQTEFDVLSKDKYDKFKMKLDLFEKNCGIKIDEIDEVILIGGTTLLPKIEEIVGEKFGKNKINNTLDRKEAVAIGAAIQGARISNLSNVNYINLLDVNNLSLGVNTMGNKMSKIIKRSSHIPIPGIEYYQTVRDNQDAALIEVFEGEDNDTSKNLFLGDFKILLPKKKAGEAKIKVKFEIDDFSLLKVTATEKDNKDNSIEKIYDYVGNYANYENIKKIESNDLEIIEPKNIGQIIDNLTKKNTQILEFGIIREEIIEKEDKIWGFSKKENRIKEAIKSLKAEIEVGKDKDLIKEKEGKISELEKQRNEFNNNIKILKQELLLMLADYGDNLINEINKMEELGNSKEQQNLKLKIFFSFVKYFSKKANEYFSDYVGENENDKNKKENNKIKEKLNDFLNKIQCDNINIIYEIIDDCEYGNEIFDLYLSFLIDNYDEKLNEQFHSKYVNLEDLQNFEYIVDRCLFLLEKIKVLPNSLKNKKKYFENFKTKIKAKEIILNRNSIENIDDIIKQYKNSLFLDSNDIKDLKILKQIKKGNDNSIDFSEDNSLKFFKKKLQKFYEDDGWSNWENFVYILETYPPNDNELPNEYKKPFYRLVKNHFYSKFEKWTNFLKKMSQAYIKTANIEKSYPKKLIYNEITKFFNYAIDNK